MLKVSCSACEGLNLLKEERVVDIFLRCKVMQSNFIRQFYSVWYVKKEPSSNSLQFSAILPGTDLDDTDDY